MLHVDSVDAVGFCEMFILWACVRSVLSTLCDVFLWFIAAAPKVVASRYMQAASSKGPVKADRVGEI